jgi:Flp pilus assembly protein TadG
VGLGVLRLEMRCRVKKFARFGRGLGERASALLRAAGGVSSIEFALTAPLMLILLMPVVDLGMGFYRQMQVTDAAEAGAQYALTNGAAIIANFAGSVSTIESKVTNATTLSGLTATPAPSESCGCPGSTGVVAATCNSTCSDGKTAGTYVTISASANYTPILRYSIFGTPSTLTASSMVRLQ